MGRKTSNPLEENALCPTFSAMIGSKNYSGACWMIPILSFGPMFTEYMMIEKDDALYIGPPFHGLIAWLRNEHNGGHFHIIIRRGKCMKLSGIISIGVPLAAHRHR